ncbi:1-acylglycerol-3-phosphate O-acyltransferase [Coemansia sp. RSA 530]|nr:1-acylglycerol-3-phosphate O-acyltransferase [Coemansia sp. RSA 564]KAJ2196557.1 1-acylglycerol-3-phosphate O-acyltransferase [Coemansia sp. RSA 522]KAJ2198416.1 1-acylglycerol-3-phosphate O-acyltransferase [Coemansia sp. RSA 530]
MHWLLWALAVDMCLALGALLVRKLGFYRRLVHFALCAAFASTAGILSAPIMWACGKRASVNWVVARTFYYTTRVVLGINVEIEGEDILQRARPCVMIGNHQTMLDLIMLGRVFPMQTVILAKKSVSYYPFVGWFMRLADDIFISRGSKQSVSGMFQRASAELRAKQVSVWFFPEGTRGRFADGPDLLPFKVGAFLLAYHAQVPVVPVVVMDFHNLHNSRRFWSTSGTLKIKILEPVSLDGLAEDDLKPVMDRTRESMLVELKRISPPRIVH